jgi:hypothetical protein
MILIETRNGLPYSLNGDNGIIKKFRPKDLLWSENDYVYSIFNTDGTPLATTDIYGGLSINGGRILDNEGICSVLAELFVRWTPSSGGTGDYTTIDGMAGSVRLVAGANVTITDNTSDKTITIASSGGTGGGGTVDGMSTVTLSGGTGISINDEFDENRIDIINTGVTSLGIQDAQSTLTGDIRLEPGSGISLVYDAHQNCINISATGVPPVSAGVESINGQGGTWHITSDNLEVVTESSNTDHTLKLNAIPVQDKMSFYMSETGEALVTPDNFPVGSIIGQVRCDVDKLKEMDTWNELVLQQGASKYTIRWGKASNGGELLSLIKDDQTALDLYLYNPTTFETTIFPSSVNLFKNDLLWDASRTTLMFSHTETILSEEIVDVTNTALYSTLDYTTMVQQTGYANSFLTYQESHQGRLVDPTEE